MNYFLDTEFSHLPWEDGVRLISIGIVDEEGLSYYACLDDFNENDVSHFVRENILKFLPNHLERKSPSVVREELLDFFGENTPVNFWSIFPTEEQLQMFGIDKQKTKSVLEELGDFDFQLMKKLLGSAYPREWVLKGKNLTPLRAILNDDEVPKNDKEHDALADALWNKEVWELANSKEEK